MRTQGTYPLTMGQLAMWRDLGIRPREQLWESNLAPVWPVPVGATVGDVRQAMTMLAARHESLRTIYRPADDPHDVRQVVLPDPLVRFDELPVREPFDLAAWPAWRVALWTPDDEVPQVRLVIHHIAADGAALQILESDFQSLLRGEPLHNCPTPRELAERQRGDVFRARLTAAAEYRAQTIAAAPPPATVTRGPLVRACSHTGIPYGTAQRAAQRLQVTLPNLLFAAYGQALAATSGRTEQLLWMLAANRLDPAVRRLVSSMTQWVPVMAAGEPDSPIRSMAQQVNLAALRAMQHGVYDPFAVTPQHYDHGSYFTFVPPPPNADRAPSEVVPGRLEWLAPRGYSGASFYLIAQAHPYVQLTVRVMRAGYGRSELERFLATMTDLLLHAVKDTA